MQTNQLNIQQWTSEIEAFVAETNRQLHELRDLMSKQFAGENRFEVQSETNSQPPRTEPKQKCDVDHQLAALEQIIARRLENGPDSTVIE